jgi:hypothetical protein
MRISTVIYVERDEGEVPVELEGEYWRGSRGTYWEPADPGEVELVNATPAEYARLYEEDDAFQERVNDALWERAAEFEEEG